VLSEILILDGIIITLQFLHSKIRANYDTGKPSNAIDSPAEDSKSKIFGSFSSEHGESTATESAILERQETQESSLYSIQAAQLVTSTVEHRPATHN
jgi:hypothetical protein